MPRPDQYPEIHSLEFDGRSLGVAHADEAQFRILPSTETETAYNAEPWRKSTTYRWIYNGVKYRVQVQVSA